MGGCPGRLSALTFSARGEARGWRRQGCGTRHQAPGTLVLCLGLGRPRRPLLPQPLRLPLPFLSGSLAPARFLPLSCSHCLPRAPALHKARAVRPPDRKLRPSQKLTEDASVEEVAVTRVPAATDPKSAGDMVGRITPKGMNSPIKSTCSSPQLCAMRKRERERETAAALRHERARQSTSRPHLHYPHPPHPLAYTTTLHRQHPFDSGHRPHPRSIIPFPP